MRFKKLSILAISTLLTGFFGCTRDNSIVDPNSSLSSEPLFTLSGIGSYNFHESNLTAKTTTAGPVSLLQKCNNLKMALVWYKEGQNDEFTIATTVSIKPEWPLSFSANIHHVPDDSCLLILTDSVKNVLKMGAATVVLFNDANNNNIFDYKKRSLDSISNDVFDSESGSDWLVGIEKGHWINYWSSTSLERFEQLKSAPAEFEQVANSYPSALNLGYNLVKMKNLRQVDSCYIGGHVNPKYMKPLSLLVGDWADSYVISRASSVSIDIQILDRWEDYCGTASNLVELMRLFYADVYIGR